MSLCSMALSYPLFDLAYETWGKKSRGNQYRNCISVIISGIYVPQSDITSLVDQ